MNEIEALKWQLERYRTVLLQQMERLYNALEELARTTLFLINAEPDPEEKKIDEWLEKEGFAVDDDGFFQSIPLLSAFRNGTAPEDAFSISWGKGVRSHPVIRRHIYCHRNIGPHLKHIHDRLGDVGWIYYQDAANTSLQYPFIDQKNAIPFDFDWTTYHTFLSVNPENNPDRRICWTPPSVDYAGEGMILSVSMPVWSGDEFIGLWSIDLPIRYLYRDFSYSKLFPKQTQFIADCQGMLVLHEKLHNEIDQTQGRLFLHSLKELGGEWRHLDIEAIAKQEAGVTTVKDNREAEWICCHCFVPGVNWILFSGLPKSEMEEAAAQRLRHAFRQISEGNFAHRVEASSTTIMSTLVDEFNKMSARLSLAEEHRQEMERELRQAQKMEAIGRLAGGVAHDYNNMISIIMGYAELAISKVDSENPLYRDLREVMNAANRSKELTRQLLAFARQQSISPMVLNINQTVHSMIRMLHPLIGEDIELVWRPGKDVWPIYIDPSQIDQILANLCVNARDAIGGVGKVIIETANMTIDEANDNADQGCIAGQFVCLKVSDNGPGMDSVILNNIFEPFFTTKSTGKGTGLGLSTVYGIVKQNNGFIVTSSEAGSGTTFSIYFPRVTSQKVKKRPKERKEVVLGNNEVLMVVEDDPDILGLLKRMLKDLDYQVIAVNSPLEAISMSRDLPQPIDMLITDVIMPDLNGRELADRLHEIFPGLKVLFMSGYTSNIIAHRGVLNDDVFLLQKPFSRKELAGKVRDVLVSPDSAPRFAT